MKKILVSISLLTFTFGWATERGFYDTLAVFADDPDYRVIKSDTAFRDSSIKFGECFPRVIQDTLYLWGKSNILSKFDLAKTEAQLNALVSVWQFSPHLEIQIKDGEDGEKVIIQSGKAHLRGGISTLGWIFTHVITISERGCFDGWVIQTIISVPLKMIEWEK